MPRDTSISSIPESAQPADLNGPNSAMAPAAREYAVMSPARLNVSACDVNVIVWAPESEFHAMTTVLLSIRAVFRFVGSLVDVRPGEAAPGVIGKVGYAPRRVCATMFVRAMCLRSHEFSNVKHVPNGELDLHAALASLAPSRLNPATFIPDLAAAIAIALGDSEGIA